VELDLVAHLADCCLSSAVAVVFDQVSIGNGTGGKTAKKKMNRDVAFC